jgi:tetratricopeptide (TPR) repeat protein
MREYRLAQNLLEELVRDEPDVAQHRSYLTLCMNNHALLHAKVGQHDQAESMIRQAIQLQQQFREQQPRDSGVDVALARSWINLGVVTADKGDRKAATDFLQLAIDLLEPSMRPEDSSAERLQALARAYNNLSLFAPTDQKVRVAVARRKSIEIQRRLVEQGSDNLQYKVDLANDLTNLASLWASQSDGDYSDRILRSLREASRLQRELLRREPFVVGHRINLAVTLNNHGMALSRMDRLSDAMQVFDEALSLQKTIAHELPTDLTAIAQLGGIHNNIAMVYQMQGDSQQAADTYELAIRFQQYAHRKAPQAVCFRDHLSRTYVNYGRVLRQLGRSADALKIAIKRRDLCAEHPDQLVEVAEEIARAYQSIGDKTDAKRRVFSDEAMKTVGMAARVGWKPNAEFRRSIVFHVFKSDARLVSLLAPTIMPTDRPT